MNLIAISTSNNYIAYAIFKDKMLHVADKIYLKSYDDKTQLKEIYDFIKLICKQYEIGILVSRLIHIEKVKKKDLRKIFEIRAIIKLASIEMKTLYFEPKLDGWERYITSGKNTLKKKLEIVNKRYDINLVYDENNFFNGEQEIANAIILGEAIAHKRVVV